MYSERLDKTIKDCSFIGETVHDLKKYFDESFAEKLNSACQKSIYKSVNEPNKKDNLNDAEYMQVYNEAKDLIEKAIKQIRAKVETSDQYDLVSKLLECKQVVFHHKRIIKQD